jgi:hypothetical protein
VAQVVLDCAGVLAIVCELVAAGMPQHVTVNEEGEARGLANPRDHALIAGHAQGCQALTDEHIDACRGERIANVRFGSQADMCSAQADVR